MAKGGAKGENTKKAAGNAKKAESAARKQDVENAKKSAAEDADWAQGAKSNAKREDAEAKKAEAARKKAERDAQLAAEEQGARAAPKASKTATKKSGTATSTAPRRGLDLAQLDDEPGASGARSTGSGAPGTKREPALAASGIDDALDALSLATGAGSRDVAVDRHPERRFKAAWAAFEARRLPEIESEQPGLRRQQRIDIARKEFEKSPDNPFNQIHARHDADKSELQELREGERRRVEGRLAQR